MVRRDRAVLSTRMPPSRGASGITGAVAPTSLSFGVVIGTGNSRWVGQKRCLSSRFSYIRCYPQVLNKS
ncbi:hypothetical protein GCM10011505_20740 [Tistrella bauzanensis]|uniref:Uncharacterized protein n=1 Tax=Tistrella bauzanensis TaxID=657419 RepID=A0ABQ1IGE5_9PROT|nr:hypothetical protein GCM10011505_20740 [Tistrella bauzanensis]